MSQPRTVQLPYTLIYDPAATEVEVSGKIEADPYDIVDGYGSTARTVRITDTFLRATFKAKGAGRQVRKDGSLGREVRGVTIHLTEFQRDAALQLARDVVRKSVESALGS